MDANCTVEITKLPTATMCSLFFSSLSSLSSLLEFYVVFARCWIIEHGAYLISRRDTDIENLHDISNIRNKHSILYLRYFDRQMKILCACKYAKYITDDWNMVNGRELRAQHSTAQSARHGTMYRVQWNPYTILRNEIINGASSWFFTENHCLVMDLPVVVTIRKCYPIWNAYINYMQRFVIAWKYARYFSLSNSIWMCSSSLAVESIVKATE